MFALIIIGHYLTENERKQETQQDHMDHYCDSINSNLNDGISDCTNFLKYEKSTRILQTYEPHGFRAVGKKREKIH